MIIYIGNFMSREVSRLSIKDNWKLIKLKVDTPLKSKFELYNLNADPGERMNVASQYPEKVEEMCHLLELAHTPNSLYPFAFEE